MLNASGARRAGGKAAKASGGDIAPHCGAIDVPRSCASNPGHPSHSLDNGSGTRIP